MFICRKHAFELMCIVPQCFPAWFPWAEQVTSACGHWKPSEDIFRAKACGFGLVRRECFEVECQQSGGQFAVRSTMHCLASVTPCTLCGCALHMAQLLFLWTCIYLQISTCCYLS